MKFESTAMEQARRTTITELRRAGHSAATIVRLTKYPRRTVYDVVAAYDKDGKTYRAEHNTRSDKKRTPRFVAGLKRTIDAKPTTPISKLAKDRQVDPSTIRRAIKEDLGYRSRVRAVKHLLTTQHKADRVTKGMKINAMKTKGGYLRFFSDEKIFTIDKFTNRRNDRWICLDPDEVHPVMKTKMPASVMVMAVISSEGHVMPPHFFKAGENVNTDVYLKVLTEVVVPWMDEVADGRPYIFQQDFAPAYKTKKVQDFLAINTPTSGQPTPLSSTPKTSTFEVE